MPFKQPQQSYQRLRDYTEKWSWKDVRTGLRTVGYVPPKNATDIQRVPCHIKYVTKKGVLEEGNVVVLKVNLRTHQRMVQFVESGEIRWVNDLLVIEVDGTRFMAH